MKKKIISIILLFFMSSFTLYKTNAYYTTSDNFNNQIKSNSYNIKLNGNLGRYIDTEISSSNGEVTLPIPVRDGYKFLGYSTNDNNLYSNIIDSNIINNNELVANWDIENYFITYDFCDDITDVKTIEYNINDVISIPNPERYGYTFSGWIGSDLKEPTFDLEIRNSYGNKEYKATWHKNTHYVNYYVNGSLYDKKEVSYNDPIEKLSISELIDNYHQLNGWDNYVEVMPDHDINLYANITEAKCRVITGHGPYRNAQELLKLFNSYGWSGEIIEAPSAPGEYLVQTDFNLTKEQVYAKKYKLARNTSYISYTYYPYLYWVGIEYTNGYSEIWQRNVGQVDFN